MLGIFFLMGGVVITANAATKKQGGASREESVEIEVGDTLTGTVIRPFE